MAHPSLARFAALLALAAGSLAMDLPAQKPKPPKPDPALAGRLTELKKLVKDRKMLRDFQAIGSMQDLAKDLDKKNPSDVVKIANAMGDVFKIGKVRSGSKDILYREAADALAKFGADGAKQLVRAADNKRFKDNLSLRAHIVRAVGKTADAKQIKFLLELTTRSPHNELRAASGEALGNYKKAKVKQQREIVKEIIKAWGSLHSQATRAVSISRNGPQDFGPQNARKTLRMAEGKWVATLQKLTGVSHSKFRDWQHWQNKNKRWSPPK